MKKEPAVVCRPAGLGGGWPGVCRPGARRICATAQQRRNSVTNSTGSSQRTEGTHVIPEVLDRRSRNSMLYMWGGRGGGLLSPRS